MLPSISIGSFILQTPGLALLIGVWIGTALIEKEAERLSLNKDTLSTLVFISLVAGLIGSRLVYAAQTPKVYWDAPLGLFSFNSTTLDPWGGLIIGVIAALIFSQRKGLKLHPTLDALAPGAAVFMIAWAISQILSGDGFGAATQMPWAIHLWDENRHPTQIYELMLAVGIFIIIQQRVLKQPGIGLNFLFFISLSSFSRLFLGAFRGDSVIWFGSFRATQLISLILLVSSLWLINTWTDSSIGNKINPT